MQQRSELQENTRILQKLQQLLNFKDNFESQIANNRQNYQINNQIQQQTNNSERDFTVCIRSRPMLKHELQKNYFDIVSAYNSKAILHNAKLNLKQEPIVQDQEFKVDYAFGPQHTNKDIYISTCRPLVELALKGGLGTMFAYGQTGSGKTFTMQGMQECISNDIFYLNQYMGNNIYIGFFELLGNKSSCLLQQKNKVDILEDQFGKVQAKGIQEYQVNNQQEFLQLSQIAQSNRRTETTFKNDVSSRTHSICQIRIQNSQVPDADDGYLYLVDLVGSENASDSQFHNKDLFKETKEINKSLMALKDCIRNRSQVSIDNKAMHVPFRQSKLTLLLKDSFDIFSYRQAKTVIIANVAPTIADFQQTLNTLRYASPLKIAQNISGNRIIEQNPENPQYWSNQTLRENLVQYCKKYGKSQINMDQLIPFETGKQFLALSEAEAIQRLVQQGFTPKKAKLVILEVFQRFADHRYNDRQNKVYKAQGSDNYSGMGKVLTEDQKKRIAEQKNKFRQKQQEKEDRLKKVLNNNKYTVSGKTTTTTNTKSKNKMEIEE